MESSQPPPSPPLVAPLGDMGLLVRFSGALDETANRSAIAFARRLDRAKPEGVSEIAPGLVSVLLTYDPGKVSYERLAGEVRLLLAAPGEESWTPTRHRIAVRYGSEDGPDLDAVAASLGLTPSDFVAAHVAQPLRVLATGFAPGFVYCGFHGANLNLPRRTEVRSSVPAGSVLFAAGQTAIAATAIPTGWHVIGRTAFRNFDPAADPPTVLQAGDEIAFEGHP